MPCAVAGLATNVPPKNATAIAKPRARRASDATDARERIKGLQKAKA